MPEVVYPTPDAEGKPRYWNAVFPIWDNDDQNSEWQWINQILESIAINNRMGSNTPEQHKEWLRKRYHEYFASELKKVEGDKHNHKEEGFDHHGGCSADCEAKIPEGRKKLMEARAEKFRAYGEAMFYLEEIFANLGGAYREFKK